MDIFCIFVNKQQTINRLHVLQTVT